MRYCLTLFDDRFAATKREVDLDLNELCQLITNPRADIKDSLPLLSLQGFGNALSSKGCLRWDPNVRHSWGIAGDYDGKVIGIEEAVERLNRAQIDAIVYSSPSYMPELPKWRVLCWYSGVRSFTEHTCMVARLNGALGGVLAGESFTLSQSYFYGSVIGGCPVHVEFAEGEPIDLRDDLDLIAIGKPVRIGRVPDGIDGGPHIPGKAEASTCEIRRALDAIPNDFVDWNEWNRLAMAVFAASGGSDEGLEAFDSWSQKSSVYAAEETPAERWERLRSSPPSRIGFGSLVYWAQQASPDYRSPRAADQDAYMDAIAEEAERDRATKGNGADHSESIHTWSDGNWHGDDWGEKEDLGEWDFGAAHITVADIPPRGEVDPASETTDAGLLVGSAAAPTS